MSHECGEIHVTTYANLGYFLLSAMRGCNDMQDICVCPFGAGQCLYHSKRQVTLQASGGTTTAGGSNCTEPITFNTNWHAAITVLAHSLPV